MLEVLFTQDSKVEDLFCGASSGSEPSLFFSNYFFSFGFKPIQDDFQQDFTRTTDEADSSVVLAEMQVALFRECNTFRSDAFQLMTTRSFFGKNCTNFTQKRCARSEETKCLGKKIDHCSQP